MTPPPIRTRSPPLIPSRDGASRALLAVVAILTFLAALAAGAADLVARRSEAWRGDLVSEATVQVRPADGRDTEADLAAAAALARATPGIVGVTAIGRAESERLLSPWLGGADLGDLPVPRLLVLRLDGATGPDLAALRRRLAADLPTASLDDHGVWLSRLADAADAAVAAALGIVALVVAATALAVVFATRGAMAGNRDIVEVLHLVGAEPRFIVAAVARRFLRLGAVGAAIGAAGAALVVTLPLLPGEDGPGGFAAALTPGPRGYAAILLVSLGVAGVAGSCSAWTVQRFLRFPP